MKEKLSKFEIDASLAEHEFRLTVARCEPELLNWDYVITFEPMVRDVMIEIITPYWTKKVKNAKPCEITMKFVHQLPTRKLKMTAIKKAKKYWEQLINDSSFASITNDFIQDLPTNELKDLAREKACWWWLNRMEKIGVLNINEKFLHQMPDVIYNEYLNNLKMLRESDGKKTPNKKNK